MKPKRRSPDHRRHSQTPCQGTTVSHQPSRITEHLRLPAPTDKAQTPTGALLPASRGDTLIADAFPTAAAGIASQKAFILRIEAPRSKASTTLKALKWTTAAARLASEPFCKSVVEADRHASARAESAQSAPIPSASGHLLIGPGCGQVRLSSVQAVVISIPCCWRTESQPAEFKQFRINLGARSALAERLAVLMLVD